MTAPHHLKITGPEDILGFIPHALGYWPENSLVAMTLQGKGLGATLRVDLPVLGVGGAKPAARGRSGGAPPAAGRGGSAKRRPSTRRRDALAGFARHVVSYLEADEAADGSLLAFFTGPGTDADTGAGANGEDDATEWADLLAEFELALEAAGMPLRDAWFVGTQFWRNAYCSDPECCGLPGRPVEQIRNSRLNAEMVFRGSSVGAAPGANGVKTQPPPVDPAIPAAESGWAAQFSPRRRDRAQFAQVLDVWMMVMSQAALEPGAGISSAPDARTADSRTADSSTAGSVDRGTAGGPLELSAELTGYLRASLCIPSWRDAVLVMAAAGRHAAERGADDFGLFDTPAAPGLVAGTTSPPPAGPTPGPVPMPASGLPTNELPTNEEPANEEPADKQPPDSGAAGGGNPGAGAVPGYGEVLLGLAPSVPDWALMDGLGRVLELLGGLGGGEPTAAAVTARGWIEWCRGRGSYADALYRQALRDRPGYRLAELLAELGGRGTLCGWAARREAAWQKFAPDAA